MWLGKPNIHIKSEIRLCSESVKGLKVRPENSKALQKNINEFGIGNKFPNETQLAQKTVIIIENKSALN